MARSVQEAAVPRAARGPFLTWLQRVLLAISCLLVGAGIVAGVSFYQARHVLLEQGVRLVEHAASAALGVPVHLGSVSGPLWNGFEVQDLRILTSSDRGAPVLLEVPRVHASYSILQILRLGRDAVSLEVYAPRLELARDARGRLNYQPHFPNAPAGPRKLPRLPPIHVRLIGGTVRWHDARAAAGPFAAELQRLDGKADLVDKTLRFRAGFDEADSRDEVEGGVQLESLVGQVRARVEDLDAARWIDYLAHNPDVAYLRGKASVQVAVTWDRPSGDAVRVKGAVRLDGVALTTRGVKRPVEDISADATFDNHTAVVSRIEGMLCGNRWGGAGVVDRLQDPAPQLRFTGGAHGIDLARLIPLVPDLATYRLQGTGEATARVSGTTHHPIVEVEARVPRGRVLDQVASDVTGHVRVEGRDVTISGWQGQLAQGRVWGDAHFTLEDDPKLKVTARWQGVGLPGLVAAYAATPPPLRGQLQGEATVTGTTRDPLATGSVQLSAGSYAQLPVETGAARFRYEGHRLRVQDARFQLGTGEVTLDGWLDSTMFAGRILARQVDLAGLRQAGIAAPVLGLAEASGSFAGAWARPQALLAHGTLGVEGGAIASQPLDHAQCAWSVAEGRLRVADAHLTGAGGEIGFEGDMGLDPSRPLSLDAEFRIDRVAIDRLEPLQIQLVPYLGVLRGQLAASGSVQARGQDWRVRSYAQAVGVESDRLGRLERIAGPVYFGHHRLTLADLEVQLTPGAQARLGGSIGLGEGSPELSLQFSLPDAPARELLASIHWPQLLQGTWIGRRMGEDEPQAPPRLVASLDGRQAVGEGLSLRALLAHWKRYRLDPLIASQDGRGAQRPFWESFDGRLHVDASIEGLADDPELKLRMDLHHGQIYGHTVRRGVLAADYRHHRLQVPSFELSDVTGASLVARGSLGPDGTLAIFGNRLDLAWLNPWLLPQGLEIGGLGDFTLIARGDPENPRFEASAEVLDGAVGPARDAVNRFSYSRAEVRASYESGRLNLIGGKIVKDGKEATLAGSLPVVPALAGNTLDLALQLDGESLGIVSALTRGEIRWLGGPGHLAMRLGGTLDQPELSGAIALDGVSFQDRNLVGNFTDVRGHALLTTEALTIQDASARHGGGTLSASGRITLSRFSPDQLQVQLLARHTDVAMTNGLYQGLVDASLDVGGTVRQPSIGGLATLSRGRVDLTALSEAGGQTAEGIPVTFNDLLVKLDRRDGVRVLGNRLPIAGVADARQMDVAVDGNLTVAGSLADPQMRGLISVRGGTFTPLYNPFDIVSGTVEFLGQGDVPAEGTEGFEDLLPAAPSIHHAGALNARLNVVAKGQIYDYDNRDFKEGNTNNKAGGMLDIKVTLTGSLDNMERRFECINEPQIPQDRIEKVLGKESLVTGIFKGSANGVTGSDIVANEVSGFLSTASRRFFNPFTSRLQDFLQLESFGFDFVPLDNQSQFTVLGLSPSLFTETRTFLGAFSLAGRYTFRSDRNVYQASLNLRANEFLSVQIGLDNRDSNSKPIFDIPGNLNPAFTGTVQFRF